MIMLDHTEIKQTDDSKKGTWALSPSFVTGMEAMFTGEHFLRVLKCHF